MKKSRESGFLFCGLCGNMLVLKSTKCAECPLCKTTRNAKDIIDKNIAYTVSSMFFAASQNLYVIRKLCCVNLVSVSQSCDDLYALGLS
ncbi:PREDICTED: uncharacterized protein LOC104709355 [Camelina sativa]|uniref:Uncharacterized protein LOC104709355 n=1 Tax=Camelina sativa TaxID=90675 RepID=A0ABM1QQ41_CAMSA|nr:PREDICTED: uncharacterized protein LOC104709355 [Camelina sativa]